MLGVQLHVVVLFHNLHASFLLFLLSSEDFGRFVVV
jgi:hypothetical protein